MKALRERLRSLWGQGDQGLRSTRITAMIFIVAGFVMIGKAWDGAASINFPTGQLPYLLSGGFAGLGLVVLGATLLVVAAVRQSRYSAIERSDEIVRLLSRTLNRLAPSGNGAGSGVQVVAGGGTYHLPDCRVLKGKENLFGMSVEQAEAEGFTPCRICNPPIASSRAVSEESGTPTR